ncbi:MAG: PKD domain-containing protein [Parafilimonas sp.]
MSFFKQLLLLTAFAFPFICLSQPKAGFTANGKSIRYGDTIKVCTGNSISYASTAINFSSLLYTFTIGSSTQSNNYNPVILYDKAGFGTTKQVVSDGNTSDSILAYVKVSDKDPNLTSSFVYSPNTNNQCANLKYQFTNNSTGNGLAYFWNFGDDITSNSKNPAHQFFTAVGSSGMQTFTVTLIVTDANGCSAVSKQNITVVKIPDAALINQAGNSTYNPILFNGSPTFQQCQKLDSYQFIFVNNSSTETINASYIFDWGDTSGTKTLDANWKVGDTVIHTYTLGLHVLTLSITNAVTGCTGVKKYNVFLGSSPGGAFGPKNNQREFCIGDTGYFNISGYEDNPPGTIYQLHFDDGSVDSIYQQPPPSTVSHVFLKPSCPNINGYFTAYFDISNPCLTTPIITPQFYVSGKPLANMLISPDTVACLNSEITITNTSDFGSVATSGGCSNLGKQVWVISPASGYTITSGTLGNLNGSSTDWANWLNGASSLNIKFTVAGTYTIKIYITNEKCGLDSITKTICARANPQALFKISGTIKCMSDTLTLQNNSVTGSCAGDAYKWTINSMDDEGCGSGAQPAFVNGSNESTTSPQVWFKEPGQYSVQLRTTALSTQNTCFAESSDTVTIKGKPKVSIDALSTICVGNSINPTATVSNCYSSVSPTYSWSFANGNPGTSNKAIPGTINYTIVGQQPVKLNVTNECGISEDSTAVNVIAKPIAQAGTDAQFCSGTSVFIGSPAVAGYSYSWFPSTGLNDSTSASPSLSFIYNGKDADTTLKYFVTASLGADCFSVDSIEVTVKKSPIVTTTPISASVCKNNSVMLIANGATSYVWSPSTYLNTTTNDTVVVQPDTTITYKIVGSFSNGCTDSSNITVTLNADAKADFTQKFLSGCAPYNIDTVINVTAYADRNLTYNWYANNILIESNTTGVAPSYTLLNSSDSVVIKLVTVSKFGCKNDSLQQKFYSGIGVYPSFKKNVSNGCEPLSVQFTNTSSNISSTNFTWNFGNGENTSNAQPDTILFHSGSLHNDTTYYVSLTAFNGCTSKIFSDSVFVKALPLARFGVNNTFGCSPDTLIITNTSLGNSFKYYWDFGDGTTTTTTDQSIFNHIYSTGISDTFIIKLTAENTCGKDTLPLNIVVEPNAIKARVNIFGNNLFGCVPDDVIFNNSTSGAATALWDFGDNTFEFLDGNQVQVEHTYNDTGTYNISVHFDNGCSDTSVNQQVIVYTHPVASFTTDKPIYCYGDSVHLNITSATGDINRLYWGDNDLFYSPPPTSHYYNNLGVYTIKLYADRANAYGTVCSDTATSFIKIGERPITSISSSNDIDCFLNTSGLNASGGQFYVWSPDSTLNNNKIPNPIAKPVTTTNYKVNITGASGCVVTDSVLVKADFSNAGNAYLIPSAFTPNGDGLNDCIRIKYPGYIQEMDLIIYNRWGQVLFHATNPSQCWDGTSPHNGNAIKEPAGTYIYTLRVKSICTAHTDLFEKGTIVLIR